MRPARDGGAAVRWLKPLLGVTRAEIEADLVRAGQGWCEDSTNRDASAARNRMRHAVVPVLARALFPGLPAGRSRALLARRATLLAGDALAALRVLEARAARVLRPAVRIQRGGRSVPVSVLAGTPAAVRDAVLRRLWRATAGVGTGLTRAHLTGLVGLIDSARGGGMMELPEGWMAVREGGVLRLRLPARHEAVRPGVQRSGRQRGGGQASNEKSRKPHVPIRRGGHLPGGGRAPGAKPVRDGDRRHPEGVPGPSGAR